MIADCPRCGGRGWLHERDEAGARECEACDGRGTVDTAPDDPRAVREPDSLGGKADEPASSGHRARAQMFALSSQADASE